MYGKNRIYINKSDPITDTAIVIARNNRVIIFPPKLSYLHHR